MSIIDELHFICNNRLQQEDCLQLLMFKLQTGENKDVKSALETELSNCIVERPLYRPWKRSKLINAQLDLHLTTEHHESRSCVAGVQKDEDILSYLKTQPSLKMFKNTFQSGFLSILYSIGSKPLQIWDKKVRNGHIKRITDNDIQSLVLEIVGTNVSTTYITCPADPKKTLGIKLPFLVMIIKNLKKYFTFEVQVLDDKNVRRRFRASNYQSTTRVKPFICTMPMRLDDGWNQIQFNLSDFTRRAYGTNYIETLRVQIHANCRIRRVYFSDRLYSEDELPAEFKLYLPVQNKAKA